MESDKNNYKSDLKSHYCTKELESGFWFILQWCHYLGYIISSEGWLNELDRIEKDSHDQIKELSWHLPGRTVQYDKGSVKVASAPSEIQTKCLPNTNIKRST